MSKSDEAWIGVDGATEWRDEGGELHRVWFVEGEKVREERIARRPGYSPTSVAEQSLL